MEVTEHLESLLPALLPVMDPEPALGNSPILQILPRTEQRQVIICFPSQISDSRPFGPILGGPPHRYDRGGTLKV